MTVEFFLFIYLFNAFLESTPSGVISKRGDGSGLGKKSSNDDSPACPRGQQCPRGGQAAQLLVSNRVAE